MYKTKGSQMYILLLKCVFAKFTINNIFCVHIYTLCVWPCSDRFRGAFWEHSFGNQVRAWNQAEPWQWKPERAHMESNTTAVEAEEYWSTLPSTIPSVHACRASLRPSGSSIATASGHPG